MAEAQPYTLTQSATYKKHDSVNASMVKTKFMLATTREWYRVVNREAKKRHIGVQEVLRAVIIPEWLTKQQHKRRRKK
jgi:hypothetical protein